LNKLYITAQKQSHLVFCLTNYVLPWHLLHSKYTQYEPVDGQTRRGCHYIDSGRKWANSKYQSSTICHRTSKPGSVLWSCML